MNRIEIEYDWIASRTQSVRDRLIKSAQNSATRKVEPLSVTLLGRIGSTVEDYLTGLGIIVRENLDALVPPRLRRHVGLPAGTLALVVLGAACSQAIGSPPEIPTSPTATSTPIARPTETPTPNATVTAEAQEKMIPEVIALIGEPIGYRPATEKEKTLYGPREINPGNNITTTEPYIPRPGVKTDPQGNLLIPRYSQGTMLGELDSIKPERHYPEEIANARQEEIARWMGQIEQVSREVRSRNFKKAKELLNNTIWVHGIESASHFDNYMFTKEKILANNPDKNGDRISDWFESAYNLIKKALSRLA